MRTWLVGFVCLGAAVAAQGCGSDSAGTSSGTPPPVKAPELMPTATEFDDLPVAAKCDVDDETQNCVEPADEALRIDDEVKLQFKPGGDQDPDTQGVQLELLPGATLDPRFKVGTIIYRGRKDRRPLMHRIEAVRVDGSKVEMKLQKVTAKQAFKRGRIRVRIPLGAEQETGKVKPQALRPLANGHLGVVQQPLTLSIGPKDCSGSIISDDHFKFLGGPDIGSVHLDFTKCKFVLTAWVDASLIWDSFANLDKFEVSVGGSVDAAMHAKLVADLDLASASEKTIFTTPDIPITIAGFVITLQPKILAGWSISGKANVTAEAGFDYTGSVEEGFGYSDAKDWYSIDERSSTFTAFGPNIQFAGTLAAQAYIKPRVDIQAYGIVGGYVSLKTFATATVTSTGKMVNGKPTGDVCASLVAGISPTVGASADIAGIKLFDEEVTLATWQKSLVTNACVPFAGTPPTDCDPNSPCCVDGECDAGSVVGATATCDKSDVVLSPGKFRYKCTTHLPDNFCLNDEACNDKLVWTDDACVEHLCYNDLRGPTQAADPPILSAPDLCRAPGCCHENADCADGDVTTIDTCVNGTPAIKGTCTNKKIIAEPGVITSKKILIAK